MEAYVFLFGLAFVWICFAVVQDLRTREISNWLNFSLIVFVLAYRAFYAAVTENIWFFLYGAGGVLLFVGLAYAFYYGRAFAGGDAKLLMGIGGILPFERVSDYAFIGGGFILFLFAFGTVYSLLYTVFLVARNPSGFNKALTAEFHNRKTRKYLFLFALVFIILGILFFTLYSESLLFILSLLGVSFIFLSVFYFYARAVEMGCLIRRAAPSELTEGDWLEQDVMVGAFTIKKSVHGLSARDIALLQKAKRSVFVKDGIPFTPAFLLAFAFMVFFF